MDDNLYAPPTARPDSPIDPTQAPPFYVVAPRKFTVLFLATGGMYQLYWFYMNWRHYKDATGEYVWPVARAVFSIFFVHGLFERVQKTASDKGIPLAWDARPYATRVVLLLILSQILDSMANKSFGSPYTDVVSILMLVPLYFVIARAQRVINTACGDPEGRANEEITTANYFWIVAGALVWLTILLGLYGMATE